MNRKPRNTEKDTKENPLGFMAVAMSRGSSRAIEDQEAAGQADFVNSTTLPTKMSDNERKILESRGVIFGVVVEDEPLFQYAMLPEGWRKECTEHNMHSDLIDEKGRPRAGIFYKAAFYDRRAHLSLNRRYRQSCDYERENAEGVYVGIVQDGGKTIYETDPFPAKDPEGGINIDSYRKYQALTKAWLEEHYPDYQNPDAYWDDE